MSVFLVAACAFAVSAIVEECSAGYPGFGCGRGCEPIVVDVDTFCAPKCGFGHGHCFDDCCCCEPVTEITTVSCVPVVETFIEPCGCGFDGHHHHGSHGYCGFDSCYDGYYHPWHHHGHCFDYAFDDCCCCEPVTEITTVSCVPVVETFVEPCGCGLDGRHHHGYHGHCGFDCCYDGYCYHPWHHHGHYGFPGYHGFDCCYDCFHGGYDYCNPFHNYGCYCYY